MWINQLPSRSRAAIFWTIGVFLLAQLALNVTIERWRPEWSDPEYGYRLRNLKKQTQSEPDRPLLLVLGSSRIGNGFLADCLPPPSWTGKESPQVFNMSLAGGTPLYELLLLKRVLAAGIHPRWVVIEVLSPWLNYEDKLLASKDMGGASRVRWSDLEILDRYAPQTRWPRRWAWLQNCLVPWYSNRYGLVTRYAPGCLEVAKTFQPKFWRENLTPHGWLRYSTPQVTREEYERRFAIARSEYTPMMPNFRVCPEVDRLFREMVETCRRERIEVIGFLRMPEAKDFRALYPDDALYLIDRYLSDLCREYETEYIDASQWLSDDNFGDGHHLLPSGAERFSLLLWSRVLERHVRGSNEVASVRREEPP